MDRAEQLGLRGGVDAVGEAGEDDSCSRRRAVRSHFPEAGVRLPFARVGEQILGRLIGTLAGPGASYGT
jgi:hypothetical protein